MAENHSPRPTPSHPLRWFPEFLELGHNRLRPQVRLLALSLLVGVVTGLGAIVFVICCDAVVHFTLDGVAGYHPTLPLGEPPIFAESDTPLRPWLLLLIPALGGLASGVLVYSLAPEAEGHGTDAAIEAYHYHHGYMRPRVPLVKILASALTLGTGGSGGGEGPIAQIGAGCGSFLGQVLRLRPTERRVLMAAGMGAGVVAIFRAPLAGALFAAEALYCSTEFEPEVIIPAGLASVTAYCTFGLRFGWKSLFDLPASVVDSLTFSNPLRLIPYLFLGLFVVVLAMLYTRTFYGMTRTFQRLAIPNHFKPAIGALLTGVVGVALYYAFRQNTQLLNVLSYGDGSLADAMLESADKAKLSFAAVLLAIALGKILTTGLTIGSGGSGGVFGPSMVIGGCGGGALGVFLHWLWPSMVPHPATFVIVGMAGFFAAAAKTPVSTLVMVSEITGNYNLLLPTLWVCALAFLLSDEQSIYSAQVESRSRSPAHQGDYIRDVLVGLRVDQFLTPWKDVPAVGPGDSLAAVAERLAATDMYALPVADAEGRLLGVISLEEVHLASQSPDLRGLVVAADLMRGDVTPLKAADRLDRALELFVENDLPVLPVVGDDGDGHVLGIVRRTDISTAYLRHVHETVSV